MVKPVIIPPASVSVHNNEGMEEAHAPENTCQYTSVTPDTLVAARLMVAAVATNENQTSLVGVPALLVQAPVGVTLELVELALDWLLKVEQEPLVGMAGNAVAPEQLSFVGGVKPLKQIF